MANPKIIRVFDGIHMGLGHDGLSKIILKLSRIKLAELTPTDLIYCINTRGDKMKIIAGGGLVLAYLKMPHGNKIMREALQYIPTCFGSTGFDYSEACRKALERKLGN